MPMGAAPSANERTYEERIGGGGGNRSRVYDREGSHRAASSAVVRSRCPAVGTIRCGGFAEDLYQPVPRFSACQAWSLCVTLRNVSGRRALHPRVIRSRRRSRCVMDEPRSLCATMARQPPDKTKNLDELEGTESRPPTYAYESYLVATCHRLRKKPIGQFFRRRPRGTARPAALGRPLSRERLAHYCRGQGCSTQ